MKRNEMQPLPHQWWQANAGADEEIEQEQEAEVEVEQDEEETEEPEEEEPGEEEETDDPEETEDDDDEVVVTVGDEAPPQEDEEERSAPKWVKELRKAHRDTIREKRELEAKLKQLESGAAQQPQKPADPGPKPTIDKFDYDADEFEKALSTWYEQKRKAEDHAAKLAAEQETQQKEWQGRLDAYAEAKSKLKVKDYDDAEAAVLDTLNQTQQGIILQGADNPALVVYALGVKPERAKELSSIKDPVKFAFAVAKLEKDLKVSNRKAPPPPERKVSGTAPKSGAVDKTLDRLRAEAEKTGDYTKVSQYKRELKRKKAG